MAESPLTSRAVRSFVIRNGRMTDSQKSALELLLPVYGVPFTETPIDFHELFGNPFPVWLEIGFGNGDALIEMASLQPQINFLGIEVHAPGVGHLLAGIKQAGLSNVRVMRHDAVETLTTMIPANSLARVLLFFPDPWHKKRHHKRRILQAETVQLIHTALVPGGTLHCATDWEEYAEGMLEVLNAESQLENQGEESGYALKPSYRPITKFEQRGLRLGHRVHDLLFEKSV